MPMHFFKTSIYGIKTFLSFMFFLVLQSCGNGQIGKQLSRSFDEIDENLPSNNLELIEEKIVKNNSLPDKRKNIKKIDNSIPLNIKSKNLDEVIVPFVPQPYRITIKLSGANPSAPAETVTKALRKAGVSFEVEKIERVEIRNSPKSFLDRSGAKL